AAREAEAAARARQREAEAKARGDKLEDDYRKINKEFNLLILHKDQDLADFHARGYAEKTLPEAYARTLADARVVTINHVLPMLHQRLFWPERKQEIVLIGVRGEVYVRSRKQEPILHPVQPGTAVV